MINNREAPIRRSLRAEFLVAVTGVLVAAACCGAQPGVDRSDAGVDVIRGWRAFHEKNCVDCHAIWDQGGRVGPDLGRVRLGRLSRERLAGVMWNHIPKMLGRMEQSGRVPTHLTQKEMSDLFALIFFVRQLDELGDPSRGEEILRIKGCSECHETNALGEAVGPDLAKWGRYANPISWAQSMWEHAPMMEEAMKRGGVDWPKLEGADLVHIIAYVRSSGTSGEKIYLRPGSVTRGEKLFQEKSCRSCHPGAGPDLSGVELPSSIGAVASGMWNHSPAMLRVMRERNVAKEPVSAQELADIVAYIMALAGTERAGNAGAGERIFAQKGCIQCHDVEEVSEQGGPPVSRLGASGTPVNMATAMWNHGEAMLARITEAGLSWPVFDDDEMVDLLAYLSAVETAGRGEDASGE